jgi:hypothetical protein
MDLHYVLYCTHFILSSFFLLAVDDVASTAAISCLDTFYRYNWTDMGKIWKQDFFIPEFRVLRKNERRYDEFFWSQCIFKKKQIFRCRTGLLYALWVTDFIQLVL